MFVSGSRCINPGACLVLVLILLFTSVSAFADSLKVANGSTLTGILDRIAKNQVHLDTGFAGILKIDQNQVLVLRTKQAPWLIQRLQETNIPPLNLSATPQEFP